jgi:hypothetical protein
MEREGEKQNDSRNGSEMEKMEVGGRKEGRKKAVRAQREVNLAGGPTIEQT